MTSLAMLNLAIKRNENRPVVRPWLSYAKDDALVVPPMPVLSTAERMAKLDADLIKFEQRLKS